MLFFPCCCFPSSLFNTLCQEEATAAERNTVRFTEDRDSSKSKAQHSKPNDMLLGGSHADGWRMVEGEIVYLAGGEVGGCVGGKSKRGLESCLGGWAEA